MLVDTNVVSELMRPRPSAKVIAWAEHQQRFHLSVVTLDEVLVGLGSRPCPRLSRWFDTFVAEHCDVLAVSPAVARRSATLRASLRRQGHRRIQADALIAATAYEHGLPLATRNVRDFEGCAIPLINPFE